MNAACVLLITILCAEAGEAYLSNFFKDVQVFFHSNFADEVNDSKETEFSGIRNAVNEDIHVQAKSIKRAEADENNDIHKMSSNEFYFEKIEAGRAVEQVKVVVDTSRVVNCLEDYFLSVAIDSYVFDPKIHWLKFNFSSPKIYTLLAAFSPTLLRIGGTPADYLFFNKPKNVLSDLHLRPSPFVITKSDIINLVGLTRSTGNRLLFDLNLQLRFGLQWDPSNVIELLEFCTEMAFGDNMDWELGNEAEYYSPPDQVLLTPQQIGNDFVILKNLLDSYPNMAKGMIVGPDVSTVPGSIRPRLDIIQGVANASGSFLKAITFHHYYFRGPVATVNDYLNPDHFDSLIYIIQNVSDAVKQSKHPNLPIWLGETSDAWSGGTPNISDRFVSGFLWLDKLGLSAKMGVGVVVRQDLYGHNYPLLDINMDPNPDYWLSWLHRLLVGERVLSVSLSGNLNTPTPTTRIYAHCTNVKSGALYNRGSVTVFGLNVNRDSVVSLSFAAPLSTTAIDVYLMEPGGPEGMLSKQVKVNGKLLVMPSETEMPQILPLTLSPGSQVLLPPLTFGFFVFPDANIDICQ